MPKIKGVSIGNLVPLALLHVGIGGTPNHASENDTYIQGKLEVDGLFYPDGGIAPNTINHSDLNNLEAGDPHSQYISKSPLDQERNTVVATNGPAITLKGSLAVIKDENTTFSVSESGHVSGQSLSSPSGYVLKSTATPNNLMEASHATDVVLQIKSTGYHVVNLFEIKTPNRFLLIVDENGNLNLGGEEKNHPSATLQLDSKHQGFLPPRLTTAQRDNIADPQTGLMVYNTDTNKLNFFNSSAWETVQSS